MTAIIPSYTAKLRRAEKHLVELEGEITKFSDTHPYEVCASKKRKGQGTNHFVRFTRSPENTDIPIVAADVIYNVRSAMDHLACGLVPSKNRDSVSFPVLYQGVWEPPIKGENRQRTQDRGRWDTCTREMRPEAIAHIQKLQPPNPRRDNEVNILFALNNLCNKDRHEKLPAVISSLADVQVFYVDAQGEPHIGRDPRVRGDSPARLEDGAKINVPEGAVDVKVVGTADIAIRIAALQADFQLLSGLSRAIKVVRELVIAPLVPYLHIPS